MKNLLLVLICVTAMIPAFSQSDLPPYKQNNKVPVFSLQQANNTVFSTTSLKKNIPVLIMFFSPGCEHCVHQFEDMQKRMGELKKYQIVMATYQPIEELAEFNKKYRMSRYPNIVTGRDSAYFLPPFYQIRNFPHMAFYNKAGKLVSNSDGNMTVDNMLKKLK